jgi:hypothetical protein
MSTQAINHFETIAQDFDEVWYFSDGYKKWVQEKIITFLDLGKNEILGDIGGGTGSFTHALLCQADLSKAYCIEPSSAMCLQSGAYEGIIPLCCDAHDPQVVSLGITRYLFKEVIHHIDKRQELWKTIRSNAPSSTKILIITRPQKIVFPLFQAALDRFAQHQPSEDLLVQELNEGGWEHTLYKERYSFDLPRTKWHTMVEAKFMSDLGAFSDDEIRQGLEEIATTHQGDTLTIHDDLIFIIATPKDQ